MASLPPETRMGPVELTVSNLERSLDYYRSAIGLRVLEAENGRASLGGDSELLVLHEAPGARPAPRNTGLFHFALLVPARRALANWLAHAIRDQVPLTGVSDHFVSEALYLRDPDAHGIEIYSDRPRELWEGQVERMTTEPLDLENLLDELDDPETEPFEGLPGGTVMGHVHLQVADIPETIRFYRDVLGFELMTSYGDQAAFLAAGGYHHHLGANTWNSAGAPPPPEDSASLRLATVVLPDAEARDEALARVAESGQEPQDGVVRDPSGNRLLLKEGGAAPVLSGPLQLSALRLDDPPDAAAVRGREDGRAVAARRQVDERGVREPAAEPRPRRPNTAAGVRDEDAHIARNDELRAGDQQVRGRRVREVARNVRPRRPAVR
jgi:catechol 2,3-dioxygenase